MPGFSQLIRAVCGVSTKSTLADGTPIPSSLSGWQPVAVVQDRRLCAGVFMRSMRGRKATYRVVVWRTYRTAAGAERAATTLFRDQVDPALALVAMLEKRMPPQ